MISTSYYFKNAALILKICRQFKTTISSALLTRCFTSLLLEKNVNVL